MTAAMLTRQSIIACILSLGLFAYMCFALPATASMAGNDTFTDCVIMVDDSAHTGFVNAAEVSHECGGIMQWIKTRRIAELDINELEQQLRRCDKIEEVNVNLLNDASLRIDVLPMVPVARVFDGSSSYYINVQGKRISADPRFHVDVPVVVGFFTEERPARRLLPLLDYIASRPDINALVSTVRQERDGDITIVPAIRGHVINFGDTSMVADKFERLTTFYRKVMPVRGWETYDTLAVKWRGQVVGTRRDKALGESHLAARVEEFDDIDDHDTMISPLHTDSATIQKN